MSLSWPAKAVVAVIVLLGSLVWLVILDLGVSAGRIHPGISLDSYADIDLGGLTLLEAEELLRERAEDLPDDPVTFTTEGLNLHFLPSQLGWEAQPLETARHALEFGRKNGPWSALSDRARAWLTGIDFRWVGEPKHGLVSNLIDEWEIQASALGFDIDRWRLRQRIKRAIVTWPRRPFPLPIER